MAQQAPMQIEVQTLIDELKAQRNSLADQVASAGAVISTQQKKIEELEAKVKELTNGTDRPELT